MSQSSEHAIYEIYERRVLQLLIASLVLTGMLIGFAVVTQSLFTIGCAVISVLGSIVTVRSWRSVRRVRRSR